MTTNASGSGRRRAYRDALEFAARQVKYLLAMAEQDGYRTDCLREACRSLDGAVRNVQAEDREAQVKGLADQHGWDAMAILQAEASTLARGRVGDP